MMTSQCECDDVTCAMQMQCECDDVMPKSSQCEANHDGVVFRQCEHQ